MNFLKKKDDGFEKAALNYFENEVPKGMTQRIDAINCFSDLSRYRFWRKRLAKMAKQGKIKMRRHDSIWASCNGMVGYGPK